MTDQQKERLLYAKTARESWPENDIAEDVLIHRTAVIGLDGFGYARDVDGSYVKMPHSGNVVIEPEVEIRAFVTIDRAVNGSTVIGQGTKIDHHVHIAHNAKIGRYNTFANGCSIEGSCEVGSYNTFGSNVTVQRKVKIGNWCRFGSGAVITKDIPDYSIVVGNPGKIIRQNDASN
jgi:UDP-3-O-[3-hydroxymyristoyl] glucosamine N-acyltransferase